MLALLKKSFKSPSNDDRVVNRNEYVLPKVAVTKVPTLDKVIAMHCSKRTKSNDWTLSRIQALTLNALAPLTGTMEPFHSDVEEVPSTQVAAAVETIMDLLGNAFSHISTLRRTNRLKEYKRELVTWAQDCEADCPNALKDTTTHLEQVPALWKARYTPHRSK